MGNADDSPGTVDCHPCPPKWGPGVAVDTVVGRTTLPNPRRRARLNSRGGRGHPGQAPENRHLCANSGDGKQFVNQNTLGIATELGR